MQPFYLSRRKTVKDYVQTIEEQLLAAKTKKSLYQAIVNAPFTDRLLTTQWSLGIVVLLLVNDKKGTIDRIALSRTELAQGAVNMSAKKFEEIRIPIGHNENIIAKAIKTSRSQQTHDWKYLFIPDLTPQQARFNQAGAGIDGSVVYPLKGHQQGALIFSYFNLLHKLSPEQRDFMKLYTRLVSDTLATKK